MIHEQTKKIITLISFANIYINVYFNSRAYDVKRDLETAIIDWLAGAW